MARGLEAQLAAFENASDSDSDGSESDNDSVDHEELKKYFKSSEEPAPFPSGPNTSFLDPTPMPRRFMADSLSSHNYRHTKAGGAKAQDPTYSTTTSEIGKLPLQAADFPIRWYGLRGEFTTAFFLGGKGPASKVNTSLNLGSSPGWFTSQPAKAGSAAQAWSH